MIKWLIRILFVLMVLVILLFMGLWLVLVLSVLFLRSVLRLPLSASGLHLKLKSVQNNLESSLLLCGMTSCYLTENKLYPKINNTMRKKKEENTIDVALYYNIEELIEIQKKILSESEENNMPKAIISFQEDILTILNVNSCAFI